MSHIALLSMEPKRFSNFSRNLQSHTYAILLYLSYKLFHFDAPLVLIIHKIICGELTMQQGILIAHDMSRICSYKAYAIMYGIVWNHANRLNSHFRYLTAYYQTLFLF